MPHRVAIRAIVRLAIVNYSEDIYAGKRGIIRRWGGGTSDRCRFRSLVRDVEEKRGNEESWQFPRLMELIVAEEMQMLGAVRQAALPGIRTEEKFEEIRGGLQAFPDGVLEETTYELAAKAPILISLSVHRLLGKG